MGAYDVPRPLIPDLIAQHGRWQGGKLAAICGERSWSWAEFDRATCRVANGLAALGLAPGARVAVLMGNGLEMLATLFGAGRAGVTVVPLNVSISDEAVAAMIADSGAGAVFASAAHCARIDGLLAAGRLPAGTLRIGVDHSSAVGLDGLPRLAGRAARLAARRARRTRDRVQHHLQLGHDRPPEGHRAQPRLPQALGRGHGDCAALPLGRGHGLLARAFTRTSAGCRCWRPCWSAVRWC